MPRPLVAADSSLSLSAPLSPSLERMVAEMLVVGFRGLAPGPDEPIMRALRQGKVGGVILFSRDVKLGEPRNIKSPSQVQELVMMLRQAAPFPLFVALDQEGGRVQRLSSANGYTDWPSPRELGRYSSAETCASARDMGAVLARVGFNLNFAPSVDLDFPNSPAIGDLERAFHRNPHRVAAHARAFVQAMRENGVGTALKHFPGHGSARGDTHDGYVDVSDTWSEEELIPYRQLIQDGFQGMIMAAHVTLKRYGDLPADLNPELINGLLRRDLGWQGVVVTDDLQMQAIAARYNLEDTLLLAVQAGVDLLVFGNNSRNYDPDIAFKAYDALLGLVRSGRIAEARIAESWQRIRALKEILIPMMPPAFGGNDSPKTPS